LGEYRRIRLECLKQYPNNFGATFEEELNSAHLKLHDAIEKTDSNNFALGAFAGDGHLIGICGFVTEKRVKTKHRGEIVQMFVDPLHAGKGIGKELLTRAIDRAFENGQTEQITLGVAGANDDAIKLYTRVGFVEYGRLDNYFKSGSEYFTQAFLVLTRRRYQQLILK